MKIFKKAWLLPLLAATFTNCQSDKPMQLKIIQRRSLLEIPSASGIEKTKQGIFVMGDDSAYLFILGEDLSIAHKIKLTQKTPPAGSLRIPKLEKPDFEAMAALPDGRLLLFGSGSVSPQRDSVAIVQPSNDEVQMFSIASYYETLKAAAKLPPGALNIEAAAIHAGQMYLFNRGVNFMANCSLDALLAYLTSSAPCPTPQLQFVKLPKVNNTYAGFSGACTLPDSNLGLFTATVEFTDNWVDDGEVAGSYIGCLPFQLESPSPFTPATLPITSLEGNWNIKIESLTVTENPAPGIYHLLLVTDSDDGASEIIEAVLTVPDFGLNK